MYAAEQKEPVKRRVALKIIKLGMDTRQVVARFEAERQALALMEHPNIAKVLEVSQIGSARESLIPARHASGLPHHQVFIRVNWRLFAVKLNCHG